MPTAVPIHAIARRPCYEIVREADMGMSLALLLEELRRRDIELKAEGRQLRCSGPPGALVPELREQLQQHKDAIIEFLHSLQALDAQRQAIVPLQPLGARPAVFAVPGHNGDVFCYRALARHLGEDQPFFGLQPPGVDGKSVPLTSVEDLAAYFSTQILVFRPRGPLVVAGYCAGGTIAFELARQLRGHGAEIRCVALFGCPDPGWFRPSSQWRHRAQQQWRRVARYAEMMARLPVQDLCRHVVKKGQERLARRDSERQAAEDPIIIRRAKVARATLDAVRRYSPSDTVDHVYQFLPNRNWQHAKGWWAAADHVEELSGPDDCEADRMLLEPYVPLFADLFRRSIETDGELIAVPGKALSVPTMGLRNRSSRPTLGS
jgi:thioesterase domain-containing protein